MKFFGFSHRAIEFSFYALFLLVPLVFSGKTSELFEFNKMWVTFILTIVIGFFWFSKMILQRRIILKRTIFDIPILLFLSSQLISSIISIDPYVSFWGYYSRWNGGLLSTISYVFLFYAFASNFWDNDPIGSKIKSKFSGWQQFLDERLSGNTIVQRSLIVSIISGFLVILWSLPSHFGYDPTCLVFRGSFDVSCWTADFQPMVRIFGPLGQPDWLAGYLGILIPISLAFIINELNKSKNILNPRLLFYSSSFILFYLSLLYTSSRSGIISTVISLVFFGIFYVYLNRKNLEILKNKFIYTLVAIILLFSFIVGVQAPIIDKFSFNEVQKLLTKPAPLAPRTNTNQGQTQTAPLKEIGGSSSLQIRKVVWRGAIDVWRANPMFGSGVETFAYSYYKHRPIEHNKLSEWNFLYNKAHNEYLNYLATTGAFGLLTYLSFIGLFIFVSFINLLNIKRKSIDTLLSANYNHKDPILLGLTSSFLSILIINFFGFSVVILNIYFFLIPAFMLIILGIIRSKTEQSRLKIDYISYGQWSMVSILIIASIVMFWTLLQYWRADIKYALGYNYNRVREYQLAYPLLHDAVKLRPEPVFLDEMSVNDTFLAAEIATQRATESGQIAQALVSEAMTTSDKLVADYPHNIVFWKSRVRILYTLANLSPNYGPQALTAVMKTEELAPTDDSVLYNLGLIYGINGNSLKAIEVLEKAVGYKPDYLEAHFALGLFYHDLGANDKGQITNITYHDKAIKKMKYILENIDPNNKQAKESLDLWEKER